MTFMKRLLWLGASILAFLLYVSNLAFLTIAEAYKFSAVLTTILGLSLLIITLLVFVLGARKAGILKKSKPFFQKGDGKRICWGFLSILCISIIGSILLRLMHGQETTANQTSVMEMWQGGNVVVMALTIAILAPIAEEIIVRGMIPLKIFKGREGLGYIVGGIIFALLHAPTNVASCFIYGGMSFVLTWQAYKTRRLEVSIATHMVNNSLGAAIMLLSLLLGG